MIVAVSNQKGGVGKTTLTVHLAAYLADRGIPVVVIDADPQGNATGWLLQQEAEESAMWEVLIARRPAEELLRPAWWGVQLWPSNYQTGDAMITLTTLRRPFDTIAKALRSLEEQVENGILLIDMPPSKAAGFQETLFAADFMLIPTQVERLSLSGVQMMANTVYRIRQEHGAGPRLLGIVPNMVRAHTREHTEHLQDLVEVFGPLVWPAIPHSIRVSEAATYGGTLFKLAPNDPVTAAMTAVCERFVENALEEVR